MQKKEISATIKLTISALFVALSIVFGILLTYNIPVAGTFALRISIALFPIFVVSIAFGPVYGGCAGFLSDFLKVLLAGTGAFNPLFSLVAVLSGVIPGLFFLDSNSISFKKVFLSILTTQLLCSVLLNSLFISLLYGTPLAALLPARAINQAIHIPLLSFLVNLVFSKLFDKRTKNILR